MAVVWSGICAVAALAAAQRIQGAGDASQMRTKVLPGHGYIRYEVLPGDEETEPGELIVVHEERRPTPPPEAVQEQSLPVPAARRDHRPRPVRRAPSDVVAHRAAQLLIELLVEPCGFLPRLIGRAAQGERLAARL